MREVNLESGAVLKVGAIPFDAANNLKKAVMKELTLIPVSSQQHVMEVYKNYFCQVFSSDEAEKWLWQCLARCTYNGLKIDKATFEPEEARADFSLVQMEVGVLALGPFLKPLWQRFQLLLAAATGDSQPSK